MLMHITFLLTAKMAEKRRVYLDKEAFFYYL